jgi:hypothetical protein
MHPRVHGSINRKKSFSIFPSPAGMSLTLPKPRESGNNDVIYKLFPTRESLVGNLVSDIPAGDGNIEKLFLRCTVVATDKINGNLSMLQIKSRGTATKRSITQRVCHLM